MQMDRSKLLKREGTVLFVVDIQEKLFPFMADREKILENIIKLIKFAGIIQLPIILTEQYSKGLGPTIKEIKSLLPDISPIEKITFSAFSPPEVKNRLTKLNARTIVIAGIETHICVTQTVLDALSEYNIHVISDATSSRTKENRLAGLERMRSAGAVISSTEMLLYELLKTAGTEEFRKALELVKNAN